MPRHVVILGNGISGVTAARFIRKQSASTRITLVSDETDHFYARTALMYVYMGHQRYEDTKPYEDDFWPKNRIELVRDRVESVDVAGKRLHLRDGPPLSYDVLVLATGSVPNRFDWPGADLDGVQSLYGMPDLRRMEAATRDVDRAVVVGGGLIGVEMAEMLHSRGIGVTFLVREDAYMDYALPPEESALVEEEIRAHGVDLRLGTGLREILADAAGRARAVVTETGEEIPCGFVGLTVGVSPNVGFLRSSGIELGRGVLVDRFFATSAPDVYAVGDCAEFREEGIGHAPVEQLWYTGRRHGKTVARTICGDRTPYDRGIFFNSAKFFGLEYQTYGRVAAGPEDGVETLAWRDPRARRLVRIDYERGGGAVLGFNVMGVRYRHEVCARWIAEGRSIERVLADLPAANFDPEFERRPEPQLVDAYYGGDAPESGARTGQGLLERLLRRLGARRRPEKRKELVAASRVAPES